MDQKRNNSSDSRLMMMRNDRTLFYFFFIFSLFFLSLNSGSIVEAAAVYKNYTVGDSLGWYDNLQKPNINYQKWVAGKDFGLGDFLIFNTDSNHSVVQTYNITTYKRCDYDNAEEDDTIQWSSADPSATAPLTVTLAVPLVKEGMVYFFSGDYDGEQCKHGQHFKIKVRHGLGLPASLKTPSGTDSSPAPTKSASGDDDDDTDDSTVPNPETVVSSNFNNPKESSSSNDDDADVKETSGSVSTLLKNGRYLDLKMVVGFLVLIVLSSVSMDI